jgi:hypothetical protein
MADPRNHFAGGWTAPDESDASSGRIFSGYQRELLPRTDFFLTTLLRAAPFVLPGVFFLLVLPGLLFFMAVRFVAARALVAERALVAVRTFFAERALVVLRFFVVALPGIRLDRVALADPIRWDVAASSAFRGPPPSASATRSTMTPVAADAAAPSALDAASLTPSAPVLAALNTAFWVLSNTLFLAIFDVLHQRMNVIEVTFIVSRFAKNFQITEIWTGGCPCLTQTGSQKLLASRGDRGVHSRRGFGEHCVIA